jgi:hypothetical protein
VGYFILDARGEPVPAADIAVWTLWFETADRSVARTVVAPDVIVLSIFSGVDQTPHSGGPLLFETRVFGGVLDGEEVLNERRATALIAHDELVKWCRVGTATDLGFREEDFF